MGRQDKEVAWRDSADRQRRTRDCGTHAHADWGHIFEDTTVAAAILDRLLHHATALSITGDSYRMRRHRDAIAALRPALTGRPEGGEFP